MKTIKYNFWEEYLKNTIFNIEKLYQSKKNIYIDLHIHSNYSIDSNQTIKDIINKAKRLKLDIIAITDHDSIDAYKELYSYLIHHKITKPIIIPGVELTIDNKEYGSQFHILKLMINPEDKEIKKEIKYQQKASWIRASKQIKRLNKNKAMKYFFKKYNYKCTLKEYKEYLKTCYRQIPEYKTMMDYIRNKTYKYNINNWQILKKMEENNNKDKCKERKELKIKEYEILKNKYKEYKDSNINERFFHRLLAIKGADDDLFPNYDIAGDLSVNNYNELKLDEINGKGLIIFAHPSENKLYLLPKLLKLNKNIKGIELNKRCKYKNLCNFNKMQKELNLCKIIGSDCHDKESDLYEDMSFYKYSCDELKLFIKSIISIIDI